MRAKRNCPIIEKSEYKLHVCVWILAAAAVAVWLMTMICGGGNDQIHTINSDIKWWFGYIPRTIIRIASMVLLRVRDQMKWNVEKCQWLQMRFSISSSIISSHSFFFRRAKIEYQNRVNRMNYMKTNVVCDKDSSHYRKYIGSFCSRKCTFQHGYRFVILRTSRTYWTVWSAKIWSKYTKLTWIRFWLCVL